MLCNLKDAKVIRGGALSIKNATGYVFRKSVAVLIFVRLTMLILGPAFFREVYYYICGFILFFFFSNNRNNLVIRCKNAQPPKIGQACKKNFENIRKMEWLSWIFSQAVEISKHHLLLRSVILKNKFVSCPWRVTWHLPNLPACIKIALSIQ